MTASVGPTRRGGGVAAGPASPLRVAMVFDLDNCRGPTGVTRHALAQLERLRHRPGVDLRLVSGRMTEPDGLAYWESLGDLRRCELPVRTRNALRWWRFRPWPPLEWWAGAVDWVYSPAEYDVAARAARLAVTSHDALQDVRHRPPRHRERLARTFAAADLILSVSRFNTDRLLEAFPGCEGRVAYVPNAADDLYFEPVPARDRAGVRESLGLPAGMPYLLSVANFQPRKNLAYLVREAGRVAEVARGELALVLLGAGSEGEERALRAEVAAAVAVGGGRALIRLPGYRQGPALRAAYAEAEALVMPSLCESFGIPAVEAMAQGTPVALADSTALPEVGGQAGWYFDPTREGALAAALADLLARPDERARRAGVGRRVAEGYRWDSANDRLVDALAAHGDRPKRPRPKPVRAQGAVSSPR